jgi:EAL domain-containing protein (putative c-di-GMP-specific phosphodiesterase class I)
MPYDFIAVAEESGLMPEIGNMVIEKACQQAALWKEQYNSTFRLAINLSCYQLDDKYLLKFFEQCLNKYNLNHHAVEIEVVEHCLIKDKAKVVNIVNQFREMGVRTAVDNFGKEFPCLNHLAGVPFDTIKIDRNFIALLGKNVTNTTIIETIIQMAKKLKMDVIAEGVETEMQQNILARYQCDSVQGNLISQPVPADRLPLVVDIWRGKVH